MEATI
jgi:protein O-mannosyl-transferase